MTKARGVAAVDRALRILDAFQGTDGTLTLAALATKTSLYKSTILRIIQSLEDYNYIRRLEDGRYQIGPKAFELGAIYQASFRIGDFVQPALKEIVRQVNESASFYVREGDRRICLFRVDGRQTIRDHIRAGDALVLDKGAAGRTLLAFERGLDARHREPTLASYGERDPDVAAIAAPVFGVGGRLEGAITVSGPRDRFNGSAAHAMTEVIRQEGARLSVTLGAPRDRVDALFGLDSVSGRAG